MLAWTAALAALSLIACPGPSRAAAPTTALDATALTANALFALPSTPPECPPCNPFNCVLPAFSCLNNGERPSQS